MFLTLEQIKKHLNIDSCFTDDDSYIISLCSVAEKVVEKHIDSNLKVIAELNGEKLPSPLAHAMLLYIGDLYRSRESISYTAAHSIPFSYEYLLSLYKNYSSVNNAPEFEEYKSNNDLISVYLIGTILHADVLPVVKGYNVHYTNTGEILLTKIEKDIDFKLVMPKECNDGESTIDYNIKKLVLINSNGAQEFTVYDFTDIEGGKYTYKADTDEVRYINDVDSFICGGYKFSFENNGKFANGIYYNNDYLRLRAGDVLKIDKITEDSISFHKPVAKTISERVNELAEKVDSIKVNSSNVMAID